MNPIVPQSARDFCTPPPVSVLLLPAPPKRLALPAPKPRLMLSAPKIAGYLPVPSNCMAGRYMDLPRQRNTASQTGGDIEPPLQRDTMVRAGGDIEPPLQHDTMVRAGGDIEPPLHDRTSYTVSIVPVKAEKRVKRVVKAEIANPLLLIDIYEDPDAWLDEFDRIYGPSQTIEEMDAEIEAKHPGWIKLKESWS